MIPLSIIVLTYNEVDSIQRCLKSISWCKDIVLIDNSTDSTLKIASKIIPHKYLQIIKDTTVDDFAKLRNTGLKLDTNDWVLFIDEDEVVTPQLHMEIVNKLLVTSASGFFIRRHDFFLGKRLQYGETGSIKLLKLGRKDKGKWVRSVHETWVLQGKVDTLDVPILHYPHPSIQEFIEHIDRWTTLDAFVFNSQGNTSSFLKIIIYPIAKFVQNYIYRFGFLDGMPGLIMALCMSFHSFLTRAKLYFLKHT